MGNENSTLLLDDSTPPAVLSSRSVEGISKYITSGVAKRIVIMTGAGISTSSGIPDFRSPETGLYANLARLNLPYGEAVFDISYFRENPLPFYTLAHELYPGRYRPTITHSFIKLLHEKGLLLKHFTQNVDCLDRQAGVPDEMIVEAHGSFARQSCIECHTAFPDELMQNAVKTKNVPCCLVSSCGGLVKPEIVFFGEALPPLFHANRYLPGEADLCFVMGTSLTVQPFASLPELVNDGVPRVLINKERVGSLGSRPDDVVLLEECDSGVRQIAKACGWLEELEAMWAKTAPECHTNHDLATPQNKDNLLEDEVNKLTREVDESLRISNDHRSNLSIMLQNPPSTKEAAGIAPPKQNLEHVFPHIKESSKKPSL